MEGNIIGYKQQVLQIEKDVGALIDPRLQQEIMHCSLGHWGTDFVDRKPIHQGSRI
jgi:hypothetical protein